MVEGGGSRLANGKGLWSGREEACNGLATFEFVLRGSSGVSARGQENPLSDGGSCDAIVLREVFRFRRGWGRRWVGGEVRQVLLGRLDFLGVG